VSRQKICQNGHNTVRKAYGNLGVKGETGQENPLKKMGEKKEM
jgi:hypothetical protein